MPGLPLRRLLVFGVCAVGVSCLYVLPSMGRSAHQAAGPRALDEPTDRRSGSAAPAASSPVSAADEPRPADGPVTPVPGTAPEAEESGPRARPSAADPSRDSAPQAGPARVEDQELPAAVADLTSAAVTPTRLSLSWPAASDNVGVIGYTVVLDGFEVATTAKTSATVRWFNTDAREHIVQVRAFDAAGNLSASSPNLLVARPTPAPTPSPTPGPSTLTPAPEPTPDLAPSPWPSAPASAGSAGEPSRDPSPSESPAPAEPRTYASAGAR